MFFRLVLSFFSLDCNYCDVTPISSRVLLWKPPRAHVSRGHFWLKSPHQAYISTCRCAERPGASEPLCRRRRASGELMVRMWSLPQSSPLSSWYNSFHWCKNRTYSEETLFFTYTHIESDPDSYPVLTGSPFGNWPAHHPSKQKSRWVKASLSSHILSAQEEIQLL